MECQLALEDIFYIINKLCEIYYGNCNLCDFYDQSEERCICQIPFEGEKIEEIVYDYIRGHSQASIN